MECQENSNSQKNPESPKNLESQGNPESEALVSKKDETVDLELIKRIKLFNLPFSTKERIEMLISWCCRQTETDIACIELIHSISRMVNRKVKLLISKEITVFRDMQINAEVAGMPLPLVKLGCNATHVSSVRELEKIITNFRNRKVFLGCASPDSVRNVENSFAIRDSLGRLRHLKCSLVMKNQTKRSCCETCKKGKKTFKQKTMRQQKMTEHKRLVLHMSPSKKEKLRVLRNRLCESKEDNVNTRDYVIFKRSACRKIEKKWHLCKVKVLTISFRRLISAKTSAQPLMK